MAKKNSSKQSKDGNSIVRFSGNRFRNGSYSAAMIVFVIAIVVIMNLVVGKVPAKFKEIDLSENKVYTLDEQSKELLKRLDTDVTIYLLASESKAVDTNFPEVTKLLANYEAESNHIKVVRKDPELYPNFGTKYSANTSTVIIVESDKRYKLVDYNELYKVTNQEAVYYYGEAEQEEFAGENTIANAVNYVSTEKLPKLYTVTGHGETAFDETYQNFIKESNIEMEDLSLLSIDKIPEDASCVAILAPTNDLSDAELKVMSSYLDAGGNALIIGGEGSKKLDKFDAFLEKYGVVIEDGVVYEGNSDNTAGSALMILPKVANHDANSIVNENQGRICIQKAKSVKESKDHAKNIKVTDLFTTTDQSYKKLGADDVESIAKEAGDEAGPFALGVAVTISENEEAENEEAETTEDIKSKLVVYGNDSLISQKVYYDYSFNVAEVLSSLAWMCESEDSITIASKSLSASTLENLTSADESRWMMVYLIIIPVFVVATGVIVIVRRNRR